MTVRHDVILFVFGYVIFLQKVVNTIKYGKQYVWKNTHATKVMLLSYIFSNRDSIHTDTDK